MGVASERNGATAAAPASGSPRTTGSTMTAGVPTSSAGTKGPGEEIQDERDLGQLVGRLEGHVENTPEHVPRERQEQGAAPLHS